MRERECKFDVSHLSEAMVIKRLRDHAIVLDMVISQVDHVFARARDAIEFPREGTVVARVRVDSQDIATLTVKVRHDTDLDRSEHEVRVDSADAAQSVLQALGLQLVTVVRKQRRVARLDETRTLSYDVVEGLGSFIEIECLTLDDEGPERLEELEAAVLAALGPCRKVVMGYDRLLLRAENDRDRAAPDAGGWNPRADDQD